MTIYRKKLYRGNNLTRERVNEMHSGVASEISTGINPTALPGVGRFSVNWHLPSVESYMFDETTASDSRLMIPFIVPPPQELASTAGLVRTTTPQATLRRLSIGFDQLQSNQAFTDVFDPLHAGNNYTIESYTFTLELHEKLPAVLDTSGITGDAGQNSANKIIWAQEFAGNLFFGDRARFNPLVIEDILVTIHPYRTYVWYLKFTGLVNALDPNGFAHQIGVSGFHLRGEFDYPPMARDTTAGSSAQNIPTVTGGARQAASISLDTAVASETITAESGVAANGRVQTNLDTIDTRLISGLSSGYDAKGNLPVEEEIVDDAGWVVMAVPMFSQIGDIRASDLNQIGLPYGPQGDFSATSWGGQLADRRVIRIQHPMTIHYVFAVANYYSPPTLNTFKPRRTAAGSGQIPASATFTNAIGVNIGSVLNGADDRQLQQVAYLTYTPATKTGNLLDRIKQGGEPPFYGIGTNAAYDQEMFSVPLVWDVANPVGMYGINSGAPFYVGQGDLGTEGRSNVGTLPFDFGGGALLAPNTNGRENFIEVRWTMTDAADLSPSNPSVVDQTTYVGNGGNWVYIVAKKNSV